MHGCKALIIGIFALVLPGCMFWGTSPSVVTRERIATPPPVPDPNMVQVDIALLERPLEDPFLDRELWLSTDQHIVELERLALLEDNGIRVGQVVGMIPARLTSLLKSERSCIDPRRRTLASGQGLTHHLTPVQPRVAFTVTHRGERQEVSLDQAKFCLEVIPTLDNKGRTKVQFTPKVQHSSEAFPIKVAPDYSGWVNEAGRPHRSFPQLGWHVSLGTGEILVIGTHLDKQGTLGYNAFVHAEEPNPMQRVLIVRTSRTFTSPEAELSSPQLGNGKAAPLALQAALTPPLVR